MLDTEKAGPDPAPRPNASLHRQILDSALDYAIVAGDLQGRITSWNTGAQRMLGWSSGEMIGQTLERLFPPADAAAGLAQLGATAVQDTGRASGEQWQMHKNGARVRATCELMPLTDDEGHRTGFVKILRECPGEVHSQAAAERSATAAGPASVYSVEGDLKFLAEASAELAGLSDYQSTLDKITRLAVPRFADWCAVDMLEEGGALKRLAVAHVDPARVELARDMLQRFPLDRNASTGAWNVLRTDRGQLAPEITDEMLAASASNAEHLAALRALGLRSYLGVPLTVHGKTLGVLSFVTAESRRRYTGEDLALAQDLARRAAVAIENAELLSGLQDSGYAKDVFLATLAHELRNPLAPIRNGLTLVKLMPGNRARVEQVAGIIERQVGQLSRLVDDLLDVSRITAGKIEIRKEPTSLIQILGAAVEMSRPNIESAHHKISISYPQARTDVYADPGRMAQVFSNLLNNAARYTPRGGKIDLVVETQPERLVVTVRDNGMGIPPEMLGKVFGLYTQVPSPAERHQGGLGIGLSLVDGLVRLHGGSVEARSGGPGLGSEFIVSLPRLPQGAMPPALVVVPAGVELTLPGAPGRRVLVVDDNEDAASTVAELLLMFGNEVDVAHDGASAIARTTDFRPDVVLLDIGLPDVNGYEVARRIRQLGGVRQPTLIALTGWGQQKDKQMAAQAGFDHHWTKPVDPVRLQELSSR